MYLFVFALIGCGSPEASKSEAEFLEARKERLATLTAQDLPESTRELARERLEGELLAISGDSIQIYGQLALLEGYRNQEADQAYREFANRAFDMAQFRKDTLALAHLLMDMGEFHYDRNQLDSAYTHYSSSYDLFIRQDSLYLAGLCKLRIVATQYFTEDFLSADEHAVQALNLFSETSDHPDSRFQIARCYMIMGSISTGLNHFDKAIEAQQRALELLKEFPERVGMRHTIYNNMSNAFLEKEDFLKALQQLALVLEAPEGERVTERTRAVALINQGRAYYGLKRYAAAEESYQAALDAIQNSEGFTNRLPRTYSYMAQLFLEQKDTARAREYIQTGRKWAEELNEINGLKDILVLQSQISPELAPSNIQRLNTIRDSLLDMERDNRNKMARIQLQTDQYIAENEDLARQRLLWIGVAAGVLLLGAAILIIITQQVRNQKLRFQQQQQEANQEIFNLMLSQSEKVEEGKHEVQKRISEDLHDAILGEMNGIRMVLLGLNAKSDEQSQDLRGQAIEKLKTVQEEIRTISHELSDTAYRKFHNFILSIEDLVSSYCESANLQYSLEYDKEIDWDGLSGVIKINLYRIIQECLQNIIKHAQASKVEVSLAPQGHQLEVTIRDNGVGYQPKRGKKGIGHKNIQSRVDKIQGDWTLKSAPGKGTQVTLYIPHHDLTALGTQEKGFIQV